MSHNPEHVPARMSLHLKPGIGTGWYDLFDESGEKVGTIYKRVQRYNLSRVYVTTEWILNLFGVEGKTSHSKRGDAVAEAERVLSEGQE